MRRDRRLRSVTPRVQQPEPVEQPQELGVVGGGCALIDWTSEGDDVQSLGGFAWQAVDRVLDYQGAFGVTNHTVDTGHFLELY